MYHPFLALASFSLLPLFFGGVFATEPLPSGPSEICAGHSPVSNRQKSDKDNQRQNLAFNIFNVDSADQFEELVESEKLTAGDTIVWADGTYSDVELDIKDHNGTKEQPINFRAASPGGVIFSGESQLSIGAQHWVISGFHFKGDGETPNAYNAVQFRGNGGQPAQHARLTDCAFTNLSPDEGSSKWVLIFGQNNSIDHCHFSGKNSKGALITVELGYLKNEDTAGHQIFRNYFGNVAPQEGTDNETIRVGASPDQNKRAQCSIRENFFFGCDGEPEIISNKSSYNVYLRNTFRKCNGSLVLRHGHHATVEGNFFFGDGAEDAGGVRVSDSHHSIVNNYFQDLTGTTWNSAFSILGGKAPSGGTSNGYQTVENIVVMHNSILNCHRSILLNKAKGSRAPAGTFANNLIVSSHEPLVTADLSPANMVWKGNLMFGAPIGADLEAITEDPGLAEADGLLRPNETGPVANAATALETAVTTDIDGQTRQESGADIGADEVSGATGEIASAPLKPSDVGVSFLSGEEMEQDAPSEGGVKVEPK